MNPDHTASAESRSRPPSFRPPFWMMLLVLAFVLVPFLFWRGTWFGRPLSEQELEKYLSAAQRPRQTQHALAQVAERILRGEAGVKRWYPQVESLAGHESPEIRATVAWVMGQDNQAAGFHASLLVLLTDSDPLVRHNAALSLVRFGDPQALRELRSMLQPYAVLSPWAGTLAIRLQAENPVNPGTLLARIRGGGEQPYELRSPLPGRVQRWLVADGAAVNPDDPLVLLSPEENQVWEALRALYLMGELQDLPEVERYAHGVAGMPDRIRQQAALTADGIRRRAAQDQRE